MMDVFKKMWPDAWGVRMEHILRNVLMALLEQPDATLHDVLRIFSDNEFRKKTAKSLRKQPCGWHCTYPEQSRSISRRSLLNRILTAPEEDLHIRRIMDQGQVLWVNLAKGRIGEDSSSLLRALLVTTIGLAAFSRPTLRPPSVALSLSTSTSSRVLPPSHWRMLSELRKYRLAFTLAHQNLNQLEPEIRHAVLGNAGSIISFRVGVEDAPYPHSRVPAEVRGARPSPAPQLQHLPEAYD